MALQLVFAFENVLAFLTYLHTLKKALERNVNKLRTVSHKFEFRAIYLFTGSQIHRLHL